MFRKIKVFAGMILNMNMFDHVNLVGARRAVPCYVQYQFPP